MKNRLIRVFAVTLVLAMALSVAALAASPSYELDLANTTKTGTTGGTGEVKITGDRSDEALYARVTWVYTLSSGDSFAYCAMKDVVEKNGALTFNMVGPQKPFGATLDAVQVALVTDPRADASGRYDALATARK